MSSLTPPARSPDAGYWRSLEQLQGGQDPNLAAEFLEDHLDPMDGPSRRRFLQVMGASLALAGAAGCSKVHRHVVPAARGIPGRVIGSVQPFATTMELAGVGYGLLAQTYEGRPIRLDGNPNHPMSLGAVSPWATASILNLYDPDRSKTVYHRPNPQTAPSTRSMDDFFFGDHKTRTPAEARRIFTEAQRNQGEGFRVLAEETSSPTLLAQRDQLLKLLPRAKWITYEPVGRDNERLGTKKAFGQPYRVHYDLSKAEVIVDLDADLLRMHPAYVQYTRQFSANRKPEETLKNKAMYNRLYCVESQLSTTGGTADHRLPLRSSDVAAFVTVLASYIQRALGGTERVTIARNPRVDRFAEALSKDLVRVKGKGVIAVGFRQPPDVHAAVHRLNAQLGNLNATVQLLPAPEGDAPPGREAILGLAQEMEAGKVQTLLILGGNPVYNAPANAKFGEALDKVPTSIHLGMYRDETALKCTWHIPQAHYLEAWGDARGWDGTVSITQPTIEPLFGGKSAIQMLGLLMGTPGLIGVVEDGYKQVFATFQTLVPQDTQAKWQRALQQGVVEGTAWKAVTLPQAANASVEDQVWFVTYSSTYVPASVGVGGRRPPLEAVFIPDTKVYDGRFNNNAWLQELPDFITKITWDNAILLSQTTANRLGLQLGQIVNAKVNGAVVKGAVFIQPGQVDESATFLLGYGRKAAGVVGGSPTAQPVGYNFYPLRTSAAMDIVSSISLEKTTDEPNVFATTQLHHEIDTTGLREREKRAEVLVRSDTLPSYLHDPTGIKKKVHNLPKIELFPNPLDTQGTGEQAEYKWGMTIDLATCTGCNACVIACQSENNIPTVGKEQVIRRREMHWLRIDRYFQGSATNLEDVMVVHQPMMCVHCENAPCEQVCPVGATLHSAEGTNDMIYNRCIGTRYCANNCPYKVRRFNFFNYQKQLENDRNDVIRMVFNPDVTVRARGVMEKCTYCIQRIRQARIKAKNDGRRIREGEVITACQQACPADAIVFGDLADENSKVSKLQASQRGYKMLEDINTRPRTSFLGRIRNPNTELEPTAVPGHKEGSHGHA